MKTTKVKQSRFNTTTKTNWQRVRDFFLRFGGDVVLDEDHRTVIYEVTEEDGLVLNLGQTSCCDEPNDQMVFSPEAINKGIIQANRLTVSDDAGEEHTLDFYQLVGASIKQQDKEAA